MLGEITRLMENVENNMHNQNTLHNNSNVNNASQNVKKRSKSDLSKKQDIIHEERHR